VHKVKNDSIKLSGVPEIHAVIARRAAEEKYFGEWRRKPE